MPVFSRTVGNGGAAMTEGKGEQSRGEALLLAIDPDGLSHRGGHLSVREPGQEPNWDEGG